MISQIAFFPVLGKPLIMWGGLLSVLCLFMTALVPVYLQKKWPAIFTFKTHVWLARATIFLALLHGIVGLLLYF